MSENTIQFYMTAVVEGRMTAKEAIRKARSAGIEVDRQSRSMMRNYEYMGTVHRTFPTEKDEE